MYNLIGDPFSWIHNYLLTDIMYHGFKSTGSPNIPFDTGKRDSVTPYEHKKNIWLVKMFSHGNNNSHINRPRETGPSSNILMEKFILFQAAIEKHARAIFANIQYTAGID